MDEKKETEEYLDTLTAEVYCKAEGMDPEEFREDPPEDAEGIAGDLSIIENYGGGFLLTALDHLLARMDWTERKLEAWETGESLTKEEALRAMEEAWKAEALRDGRGPSKQKAKTYFATIENPAAGYYDEVKTDCASAAVFGEKKGRREPGEVITIKTPSGRVVSSAKWSKSGEKYEYC